MDPDWISSFVRRGPATNLQIFADPCADPGIAPPRRDPGCSFGILWEQKLSRPASPIPRNAKDHGVTLSLAAGRNSNGRSTVRT
jgi:hypothetical protein